MKRLPFIKNDDLQAVKANAGAYKDYFKEDTNTWLFDEFGPDFFEQSKLDMPEIQLAADPLNPSASDADNVQTLYWKLRFISNAQASDERLWAGLALGPFWKYVQDRWDVKNSCTKSNILQHYFFAFGPRRSLTRNAISRLWWTGRLTHDPKTQDPWELTRFVCRYSRFIVDILERSMSNNPAVIRPFIRAVMDAEKEGIGISTQRIRDLAKYLDELGGVYILDCLPEREIHDKILNKAEELEKTDNAEKDKED
ncbi:MAG: DUF6339 family protein [Lachnospiraceae bacterium]|nr:DUF6339 family protein [Lachnospiraceae bacterium]